MSLKLNKDRPICPQIEERICVKIAKKELLPGEKIMSVREMAVEACVNPNTVQKAFEGLEAKGLLCSVRGSGWFVTENTEKAKNHLKKLILTKTEEYLSDMKTLGVTFDEIKDYIKECYK